MTTAYFPPWLIRLTQTATVFIYCTLIALPGNAQEKKDISRGGKAPEAWEYAVVFNSAVQTNLSFFNTAIADTQLNAGMEGLIQISVKTEKNGSHVCCRFTSISELNLPLPESVEEAVNKSLRAGFCFTRHSTGLIDSIFFHEAPGDAAEHLIIQFIEGWQYFDPGASGQQWTNEIYLSDGKVNAVFKSNNYALVMDSLSAVYKKSGRHPDLIPQHTVYKSSLQFGFEKKSDFPSAVNGFINRQSIISHHLASEMKNSYAYKRKNRIKNNFSHSSDAFNYSRPLYYPQRVHLLEQKKNMERAVGIQSADLEVALAAINDSTTELLQQRLSDDLKAFLLAEKPLSEPLENIFLKTNPRTTRFKLIRAALIGAATAEAQEIIVKMIKKYRREDANLLRYIVPSAGLIQTPGYALQRELEDLVTDAATPSARKSSIYLSLGNMAGALNETTPSRADSLVERLIHLLKPGNDPMLLLSVLGNAGTYNAMSAIQPFLQDTSETIRGMAYYALRFIEHEMVDSLYLIAVSDDSRPSEITTGAILEAMFYRAYRPETLPAFEKLLHTGSEKLQLQCLQLICHYSYHYPSLMKTIRTIAATHPNIKLREAAASFR
ncbi:MAG: hypothetical protein ACO1NW_08855 [Chitinophagaceae bacterium]